MPHLCFSPPCRSNSSRERPPLLPTVSLKSIAFLLPLEAPLHLIQPPLQFTRTPPVLPVFGIDTSIDDALNVFDEMGTRFMVLGCAVRLMLQMPDRHMLDRIAWCLNML
ncbi:hypothetical protein GQ55_3G166100 [Panicum hallii var. hallii]|uniref:Uncharacterized protein n=1 Tax=Panicum hallii var. hallii TaxID=1504633 RepID=A0A2T7EA67_9POAL|nr:hypothetical protein GQ55_3G166100 [Panicum hallii var. hallii]